MSLTVPLPEVTFDSVRTGSQQNVGDFWRKLRTMMTEVEALLKAGKAIPYQLNVQIQDHCEMLGKAFATLEVLDLLKHYENPPKSLVNDDSVWDLRRVSVTPGEGYGSSVIREVGPSLKRNEAD